MENWHKKVRKRTEPIFQAIINHDFIKELLDGSLDKSIFEFYIQQDSIYLAEYKKSLSQVGIKCIRAEDGQFFLSSATGIIDVENALHQTFMSAEKVQIETSPACELYISYLSRMTANYPLEVGLAAILPCFTIYKEVGDYILQHQSNPNNPYQNWINTYGGEAFAQSVEKAVEITNYYAQNASSKVLALMEEAYIKSSKLEWMFWDSAYQKEKWKI